MSRYLMVPVQLDALYVAGEELSVVKLTPDFPVQPYIEPALKEEMNSDTANVSDSLVSPPFQNQTLRLTHGVHLHWALPDALTRGDSALNFPAVPSRWLVTRKRKVGTQWQVEKQWVVESDYLFPPHVNKQDTCVSIPHTSAKWHYNDQTKEYQYQPQGYHYRRADIPQSIVNNPELFNHLFTVFDEDTVTLKSDDETLAVHINAIENKADRNALNTLLQKPLHRAAQPYRYMGRKLPVAAYKPHFKGAEYYAGLSAVGYGDPAFAAFYPNCFSVFGLHDQNPGDDLSQLRYEVAGWYGNEADDVLTELVNSTDGDVNAAIEEKFNWKVEDKATPERLLCYADIGFDKAFNPAYQRQNDPGISITVANTATEALSACLADRLVKDKPDLSLAARERFLKSLEDQLEAMQVAFRLDEKKLDTVARFKELRHENGFTPLSGGELWVIRKQSDGNNDGKNLATPVDELPMAIAKALNQINEQQKQYNLACQEISSMRKQLFADWYKYMISVYPPDMSISDYPSPDLVKHFIRSKMLTPLNNKIDSTGELYAPNTDDKGHINGIKVNPLSCASSLACVLAEQLNLLISAIELAEDGMNAAQDSKVNYYLEQIPAPRYWQPNNPVVLIEGDAAKATQRHGADGLLSCPLYNKQTKGALTNQDFTDLSQRISEACAQSTHKKNADKTSQPWNPFLLQWQTQLFSTQNKSNLHANKGSYSRAFITDNYHSTVLNPDLSLKTGKGRIAQAGDTYSGNSLLTPQANSLLKHAIETQLTKRRKVFAKAEDISVANYSGEKHFDNPIYSMICAYEKLQTTHVLAQSLNGFNQSLLMRKQTLELHIDDPLGFEQYQSFSSAEVLAAMGGDSKEAPSPLNAFNPIRSGCLKLLKLRLIDTFGQVKVLDTNKIDTTYKMTSPASQYLIKLPPRLTQPARLNFRWLDSTKDHADTNAHTATSPICGWLLNNKFDHSLMVYDSAGKALGYFKAGRWLEAVDSDKAIGIDEIANPHLQRVVQYVADSLKIDAAFLTHFIGTTEDALENIQTEKDSGITGPAMLIGRPMAVVRTALKLQLSGMPAVNQDWNVFRGDMAKNSRTTDKFTKVNFPLRLGEYGQLNDGLVGYWLEKAADDGSISFSTEKLDQQGNVVNGDNALFYSPQSDYIDTQTIESRFEYFADAPINFYQSLDDAAQTVTVLMDVQGCLHATVGILPNKQITIPAEHYTQALQNIEVSFLHAPILTPQGQTHLDLRPVSGFEWSWVEQLKNDGQMIAWEEHFVQKRIEQAQFVAQYQQATGDGQGDALWQYLLRSDVNWLAAVDDNDDGLADAAWAKVVGNDDRISQSFADQFEGKEALVGQLFKQVAVGIDATITDATFMGQQELREGWLKLRRRKVSK
jgi:hypothetical protein